MKRAGDWIPANVLAAAKRAGLTTPLWYVGRSRGPAAPRKKTLQDLERECLARSDTPFGQWMEGEYEKMGDRATQHVRDWAKDK